MFYRRSTSPNFDLYDSESSYCAVAVDQCADGDNELTCQLDCAVLSRLGTHFYVAKYPLVARVEWSFRSVVTAGELFDLLIDTYPVAFDAPFGAMIFVFDTVPSLISYGDLEYELMQSVLRNDGVVKFFAHRIVDGMRTYFHAPRSTRERLLMVLADSGISQNQKIFKTKNLNGMQLETARPTT